MRGGAAHGRGAESNGAESREQRAESNGAESRGERDDMCRVGMAGEGVRMGARGYKIGRT